MRNSPFLLFLCIFCVGFSAHAQVIPPFDPKIPSPFLTGLSGFSSLGDPVSATVDGTSAELIQSTGSATSSTAVSVANVIDPTLGVTLPNTVGTPPGEEFGSFAPTDGQAIYQAFTLGSAATLSFEYAYSTNDYYPFDSVGVVVDGTYTQLVQTPYYTDSPANPNAIPTSLMTYTVPLSSGNHTIAFVAYNTSDMTESTSLYITDIAVPEPKTYLTMALGLGGLLAALRFRARLA